MSSSLPSTPQPSRLLLLPTELRLQIYADAFISQFSHYACGNRSIRLPVTFYRGVHTRFPTNALLSTCRQVYDEALPILYRSFDFLFSSPLHLTRFLTDISETARANIRYIGVDYGLFLSCPEAFRQMARCKALERLHLVIKRVWHIDDWRIDAEGSRWECILEAEGATELRKLRDIDGFVLETFEDGDFGDCRKCRKVRAPMAWLMEEKT